MLGSPNVPAMFDEAQQPLGLHLRIDGHERPIRQILVRCSRYNAAGSVFSSKTSARFYEAGAGMRVMMASHPEND